MPLAACLAAILMAQPTRAAIFIVNSTADVPEATPGNGNCNPVDAAPNICTLRAAIQEANALSGQHQILVQSGNYVLTRLGEDEETADTGDLDITGDITLINGTDNPPVFSGNFSDRVFEVHTGGRLRVENIEILAGVANTANTEPRRRCFSGCWHDP